MKLEVLFSRGDILGLNKPAGMISQGPGGGRFPELWEVIRQRHPAGNVVHRIDQFTSGINLAATSRVGIRYMMSNWHQITKKRYLAIILNPFWNETVVEKTLDGKTATTAFTVLERNGCFALVQCELVKNGRQHQIRRHLKSLGSPIVGDRKYKGLWSDARQGQLLHAWRMEFRLPNDMSNPGHWTSIQAPVPDDFKAFRFNWARWDHDSNTAIADWPVAPRS